MAIRFTDKPAEGVEKGKKAAPVEPPKTKAAPAEDAMPDHAGDSLPGLPLGKAAPKARGRKKAFG